MRFLPSVRKAFRACEQNDLYTRRVPLIRTMEHVVPRAILRTHALDPGASDDLHNIFPVDNALNCSRADFRFAEWGSEAERYSLGVDFEAKVFRPPLVCRGVIARTIMYMSDTYHFDPEIVIESSLLDRWLVNETDEYELVHDEWARRYSGKKNPFLGTRIRISTTPCRASGDFNI